MVRRTGTENGLVLIGVKWLALPVKAPGCIAALVKWNISIESSMLVMYPLSHSLP